VVNRGYRGLPVYIKLRYICYVSKMWHLLLIELCILQTQFISCYFHLKGKLMYGMESELSILLSQDSTIFL